MKLFTPQQAQKTQDAEIVRKQAILADLDRQIDQKRKELNALNTPRGEGEQTYA